MPLPSDTPVILNEQEAADFLAMSPFTLAKWRSQGRGPAYRKVGGKSVRYAQADLITYLESQERIEAAEG